MANYLNVSQSTLMFECNQTDRQGVDLIINKSELKNTGYRYIVFKAPVILSQGASWIQYGFAENKDFYIDITDYPRDSINTIAFEVARNDLTESRSFSWECSIQIQGANEDDIDEDQMMHFHWIDTQVLSVNIIQEAAVIETEVQEVDEDKITGMTEEEVSETRKQVMQLKSDAQALVAAGLTSLIILAPEKLLAPLIEKFTKIAALVSALETAYSKGKELLEKFKKKKKEAEEKLSKENLKKFPNEAKKKFWNKVKEKVNEQIKALTEKLKEMAERLKTFAKDMVERIKGAILGSEIYKHLTNLKTQAGIIGKAVPSLVQNASIATVEPSGAVVVTPSGPGSVAANAIQTAGTIKRLASQASALITPLCSAIDSAVFLGMPTDVVKPLVALAASISVVAAL